MSSYRALARRYRPQRLVGIGRVYEPTAEEPYWVEVQPYYGHVLITINDNGKRLQRVVGTSEDMDAAIVDETVRQMISELGMLQ